MSASGAVPIAVTNCLNFGSPEDPEVMWQFAEATRGLADGCRALGIPVTGGNVSFYNSTAGTAINPTPVIGVLGLFDDVARRTPIGFAEPGEVLLLLGDTADELGGSEWAWAEHRHLGGTPAAGRPRARAAAVGRCSSPAAATACCPARTTCPTAASPRRWSSRHWRAGSAPGWCSRPGPTRSSQLFSESAGRALVTVPRSEELRFTEMCSARGLPCRRIGVTDGTTLDVQDVLEVPLDRLRAAHEGTLPALFGPLAGATADDPAGPALTGPAAAPGARQPDLG